MCDVILVSLLHFFTDGNEVTLDTSAVQKRTLTIVPATEGMHQDQISDLKTPKQNTQQTLLIFWSQWTENLVFFLQKWESFIL